MQKNTTTPSEKNFASNWLLAEETTNQTPKENNISTSQVLLIEVEPNTYLIKYFNF